MSSLLKLTNNALGRLSANASAGATTLSLVPGDGAKFPTITGSQFFPATLIRASDGAIEIVKVTARSSDTLTVTRGQETTTALAFVAGDRIELRMTAKTFTDEFARMDADIAASQETSDDALAATASFQASLDAAEAAAALADEHAGDALAAANTAQATADSALAAADALRDIESNPQSTAYVLDLTDRGKSVDTSAGVTIPANSSVAFPVKSVVSVTNVSGSSITLTPAAGVTLRLAGTSLTGARTILAYGMVTMRKVATDTWYVTGAGVQ